MTQRRPRHPAGRQAHDQALSIPRVADLLVDESRRVGSLEDTDVLDELTTEDLKLLAFELAGRVGESAEDSEKSVWQFRK